MRHADVIRSLGRRVGEGIRAGGIGIVEGTGRGRSPDPDLAVRSSRRVADGSLLAAPAISEAWSLDSSSARRASSRSGCLEAVSAVRNAERASDELTPHRPASHSSAERAPARAHSLVSDARAASRPLAAAHNFSPRSNTPISFDASLPDRQAGSSSCTIRPRSSTTVSASTYQMPWGGCDDQRQVMRLHEVRGAGGRSIDGCMVKGRRRWWFEAGACSSSGRHGRRWGRAGSSNRPTPDPSAGAYGGRSVSRPRRSGPGRP